MRDTNGERVVDLQKIKEEFLKQLRNLEHEVVKYCRPDFEQRQHQVKITEAVNNKLKKAVKDILELDVASFRSLQLKEHPTAIVAILNFYEENDFEKIKHLGLDKESVSQLYGRVPLYYQSQYAPKVIQLLSQLGIDPNLKWHDEHWLTFLVKNGNQEALETFLDCYKGTLNLDVYDVKGHTPLMDAIYTLNDSKKARALIEAGADCTLCDKDGDRSTLLDMWFARNLGQLKRTDQDDLKLELRVLTSLCERGAKLKTMLSRPDDEVFYIQQWVIKILTVLKQTSSKSEDDPWREQRQSYLAALTLGTKKKRWISRFLAILGKLFYWMTFGLVGLLVSKKRLNEETLQYFQVNTDRDEFESNVNRLCFFWGLKGHIREALKNPPLIPESLNTYDGALTKAASQHHKLASQQNKHNPN